MNKIFLFSISFLLFSCGAPDSPEKTLTWEEQYAQITHVDFPKGFKLISNSPSNSNDLIKKTIIDLSQKDCQTFYKSYGFMPVEDTVSQHLFSSKLMDSIYKLIPDRKKFLHLYGKKSGSPKYFKYNIENDANWVYLLDTTTCRLYCLISNADFNGYTQ